MTLAIPLLGLLAVMSGCGHFLSPQDYKVQPHQGIAPNQANQSTVVFLWPDRKYGAATLAVLQNGAVMGALQGGTYFAAVITPGPHQFSVDSGVIEKSLEQVSLTAQPGKTYFIRYSPSGFYVAPKLDLITEEVALAQLPGLSTIELTRH